MLAIERQNKILDHLRQNQTALVGDLSKEYHVTEETIRRDLEKLERRGLIKKTYGGAVYGQNNAIDMPLKPLDSSHDEEGVAKIAQAIASMIRDGETLMLDSSAVALATARHLRLKRDLTIVTNSLEILMNFIYTRNVKIICTGGVLRHSTLCGASTESSLRAFHVDKAIISCSALHRDYGLSEDNEQDAEIKRLMTRAAERIIVGIELTKFDTVSFVQFLDVPYVHTIVTNELPNPSWRDYLRQHQIDLVA